MLLKKRNQRSREVQEQKSLYPVLHVAGSLKLCDDSKLRELGYHAIHLKRHNYFMLYKIIGKQVFITDIYHDLQDYEGILR